MITKRESQKKKKEKKRKAEKECGVPSRAPKQCLER
jgi:hypothetical protein